MPTKKETHAERSRRFSRRAIEEQYKGLKTKILDGMKHNPEIMPQLYRCLVDHGAVLEADVEAVKKELGSLGLEVDLGGARSAAAAAVSPRSSSTGPSGSASVAGSVADSPMKQDPDDSASDLAKKGHRNYCSLRSTPSKTIEAALTHAEPATFSVANLKSLVPGGKRVMPREPLLQLVEFVTGLDPDFHIPAENRTPAGVCSLIREKNGRLGNRGKDIVLPADWMDQSMGVYRVKRDASGAMLLENTFTKATVTIPEIYLKTKGNDRDVLELRSNFSEARACLHWQRSGDVVAMCTQLLPMAIETRMNSLKRASSSAALGEPEQRAAPVRRPGWAASVTDAWVAVKAGDAEVKEQQEQAKLPIQELKPDGTENCSGAAQPVGSSEAEAQREHVKDEPIMEDEPENEQVAQERTLIAGVSAAYAGASGESQARNQTPLTYVPPEVEDTQLESP